MSRRSVDVHRERHKAIAADASRRGITVSSWLEDLLYEKLTEAGVEMDKPKLTPARKKNRTTQSELEPESEVDSPISCSGVNFL